MPHREPGPPRPPLTALGRLPPQLLAACRPGQPDVTGALFLVADWLAEQGLHTDAASLDAINRSPAWIVIGVEQFQCARVTADVLVSSFAAFRDAIGLRISERALDTEFSLVSPRDDAPYLIARTTVTQRVYEQLAGQHASVFKGPMRPVENEHPDELMALVEAVELDLPDGDQWTHACRAGSRGAYAYGSRIGPCDARFFNRDTATTNPEGTADVGTFPPNALGLHEMHGNVWEWFRDADRSRLRLDGLRGGGWTSQPHQCRTDSEARYPYDPQDWDIGIRLAKTLDDRGG